MKKYHTLLQKSDKDGLFYPQFGSWDKSDVQYERDDIRRSEGIALKDFIIISTPGTQSDIDAQVNQINTEIQEQIRTKETSVSEQE